MKFTTEIPKNIKDSLVIIAVKPQNFENLEKSFFPIQKNNLIISIMAGVTIKKIKSKLKTEIIVRAMPNLNSAIKKGYTVLFGNGLNKVEKKNRLYFFNNW